ncbi:MAG: DegV family protein [Clostridium sp.]
MKKVAVITDSNSGITQSEAKKLGIHVVPMPFFVNGDTFYEDISMSQDEFYGYLAQGADVMTSQPAPDTLMKLWDSVLECYDEIVYIPMSSGLSSSCGTAMMLSYEEKYENKEIGKHKKKEQEKNYAEKMERKRCDFNCFSDYNYCTNYLGRCSD